MVNKCVGSLPQTRWATYGAPRTLAGLRGRVREKERRGRGKREEGERKGKGGQVRRRGGERDMGVPSSSAPKSASGNINFTFSNEHIYDFSYFSSSPVSRLMTSP